MKKTYLNLVLASALALSPLGAGAASLIDLGYGSSSQSGAAVENSASVRALPRIPNTGVINVSRKEVDADVRINTNANANVGSGSSNASGSASLNASSTPGANRQNTGLPNATSTSASATGQLNASAQSNLNMTAGNVSTEEDLRAYAVASIRGDKQLEEMNFESDRVVVVYNDEGRFIGFIPVRLAVTVSVGQDGEVNVDYPWYGFLVAKDKADIESRVRAEIDASLAADANGWTNSDRAELAEKITAALRAHYEATATADATSE